MTASMGCAIVGVGETRYVRGSGVSTLHLGTEFQRYRTVIKELGIRK